MKKLPREQWPDHKACSKCKIDKNLQDFYKKHTGLYEKSSQCKNCQDAYEKEKISQNPEKAKDRYNLYRANNLEKIVTAQREAYKANPERSKAATKSWKLSNAGRVKEYSKKHRQENIETYREFARIGSHNYRARLYGAAGKVTKQEWNHLLDLCKNSCLSCGKNQAELSHPLEKDHIIALNNGGSNYVTNIQPLCRSCNASKSDIHSTDYRPENVKQYFMEIRV